MRFIPVLDFQLFYHLSHLSSIIPFLFILLLVYTKFHHEFAFFCCLYKYICLWRTHVCLCICMCVCACIRPMPKTSLLEPHSKSGMLPVAHCRCHCLFLLLLPLAVLPLPLLLLFLLLLLVVLAPLGPHHRLLHRRRRRRRFVCVNATRDGYLNYWTRVLCLVSVARVARCTLPEIVCSPSRRRVPLLHCLPAHGPCSSACLHAWLYTLLLLFLSLAIPCRPVHV